jgi:rhamnose utilization protein RhaD (predicted bifunctional aldolase and dehydrogenase)
MNELYAARDCVIEDLLSLSHEIGREERGLVLLGEGNTSARYSKDTYLVKASGCRLDTLEADEVVECRLATILPMLDREDLSDKQIEELLLASRVDKKAKKPSVEAVFHAWLLSLPGVNFVGHSHGMAVNQILCSPRAREFAERRMFPDEIVCCGVASVFIPMTDPGVKLAQAIRRKTESYIAKRQCQPRVILMQNHGLIALGGTWQSVFAATLMAEKAARIFMGAAQLGGPVFLSDELSARIAGRPDEAYRQRALKM